VRRIHLQTCKKSVKSSTSDECLTPPPWVHANGLSRCDQPVRSAPVPRVTIETCPVSVGVQSGMVDNTSVPLTSDQTMRPDLKLRRPRWPGPTIDLDKRCDAVFHGQIQSLRDPCVDARTPALASLFRARSSQLPARLRTLYFHDRIVPHLNHVEYQTRIDQDRHTCDNGVNGETERNPPVTDDATMSNKAT